MQKVGINVVDGVKRNQMKQKIHFKMSPVSCSGSILLENIIVIAINLWAQQ